MIRFGIAESCQPLCPLWWEDGHLLFQEHQSNSVSFTWHMYECAWLDMPPVWAVLSSPVWVGGEKKKGRAIESRRCCPIGCQWTLHKGCHCEPLGDWIHLRWILGDLIFCSLFKSFEFDLQTCLAGARVAWLALHYNWFNYQTFNINSFYASEYQVVHVEHEV